VARLLDLQRVDIQSQQFNLIEALIQQRQRTADTAPDIEHAVTGSARRQPQ
jgi:hypothetical protein